MRTPVRHLTKTSSPPQTTTILQNTALFYKFCQYNVNWKHVDRCKEHLWSKTHVKITLKTPCCTHSFMTKYYKKQNSNKSKVRKGNLEKKLNRFHRALQLHQHKKTVWWLASNQDKWVYLSNGFQGHDIIFFLSE